jgi:hypothetical protein
MSSTNTKIISTRAPLDFYMEILQVSSNNSMSISDYVLQILYRSQKNPQTMAKWGELPSDQKVISVWELEREIEQLKTNKSKEETTLRAVLVRLQQELRIEREYYSNLVKVIRETKTRDLMMYQSALNNVIRNQVH